MKTPKRLLFLIFTCLNLNSYYQINRGGITYNLEPERMIVYTTVGAQLVFSLAKKNLSKSKAAALLSIPIIAFLVTDTPETDMALFALGIGMAAIFLEVILPYNIRHPRQPLFDV